MQGVDGQGAEALPPSVAAREDCLEEACLAGSEELGSCRAGQGGERQRCLETTGL